MQKDSREDFYTSEGGQNLLQTYGTEQAYKELGCLIEFMNNDLKAVIQFENASIHRVYFSDLWYIFDAKATPLLLDMQ